MKIHCSNRHRGNASPILLAIILLVGVATLILVYQIYQNSKDDGGTQMQRITKTGDEAKPGTKPANPAKPISTNKPVVTPVIQAVSNTNRSPLPQPGEVIDKPIAPTVLAVPAELKATAPAPKKGEVIHWSKAREHIGHDVTIEGKIVQANNIGAVCFLNFTNEPRGGDKFYLVIFKDKFSLFGGKPEVFFKDKTVRVTGKVEEHKGRPQMKVKKSEQVQIVVKAE